MLNKTKSNNPQLFLINSTPPKIKINTFQLTKLSPTQIIFKSPRASQCKKINVRFKSQNNPNNHLAVNNQLPQCNQQKKKQSPYANRILKWNTFKLTKCNEENNQLKLLNNQSHLITQRKIANNKINFKQALNNFYLTHNSPNNNIPQIANTKMGSKRMQQDFQQIKKIILLQKNHQKRIKQDEYSNHKTYKKSKIQNNKKYQQKLLTSRITTTPQYRPWSEYSISHPGGCIRYVNTGAITS